MTRADEGSSGLLNDVPVVRRRGRELAKLVGAVVAAFAGLALVCHALWGSRNELPSRAPAIAGRGREGASILDNLPLARGERVFQTRCVRCHGPQGHGDGSEMANSRVRPRDLAAASWRSGAVPDKVRRVIEEGTPDKSMPGLAGAIPASELDALVDYVFSLEIGDLLSQAGFSREKGQSAPELSYRDVDGTAGSLDQLRGKVVLVAFWGTTCPPCLEELPELESLADRYEETDFVVVPVSVGDTDAGTVYEVGARHAPGLPVYVVPDEESVREQFQVRHLPQTVLVDREGRMLGRSFGGKRWTGKELEKLLSACLGSALPLTSPEASAL
jgi:thiol-disulfide isomerase/thioredoxin